MAEHSYNFQNKELSIIATPEDIEENWLWAVLSYFGPLFLLVMMIKRQSIFAIYHARQGMGLFIISIFCFILWVSANLYVPADLQYAFMFLNMIFGLVLIVVLSLGISGIINAYKGDMKPVNLFGKYFEKKTMGL
ncbi:MAG: hypothetical protein Q8L47_02385 [bacterium]|nr:hypothetical protein [bacterium]